MQENPEGAPDFTRLSKGRRWRLRHPEKVAERSARRKARKLGLRVTSLDYVSIFLRDKGLCHICGNPAVDVHYDHVVPLARGGAHAPENIRVSCASCNLKKGDRVLPSAFPMPARLRSRRRKEKVPARGAWAGADACGSCGGSGWSEDRSCLECEGWGQIVLSLTGSRFLHLAKAA